MMELVDGGGMVDWTDLNRHGIAVQHVPLDDSPLQRIVPTGFFSFIQIHRSEGLRHLFFVGWNSFETFAEQKMTPPKSPNF